MCVCVCACVSNPDDIEVILYEDKQENSASGMNLNPWLAKGRFGPNDVHHQVSPLLFHNKSTHK